MKIKFIIFVIAYLWEYHQWIGEIFPTKISPNTTSFELFLNRQNRFFKFSKNDSNYSIVKNNPNEIMFGLIFIAKLSLTCWQYFHEDIPKNIKISIYITGWLISRGSNTFNPYHSRQKPFSFLVEQNIPR